jgi:prophage tail gpP-like protein
MNEIYLKTSKGEFKFWDEIYVNLKLDTVASTFEFGGLFNEDTKYLFKPFSYEECEVWIKNEKYNLDERLISGYITNPAVKIAKKPNLNRISGFSKPGILENANFPKKLFPLQWKNVNLRQIAEIVCNEFHLTLHIHGGAKSACEEKYNMVECSQTQTVKSFLSDIGYIKGVTIAHDNLGRLFLYRILDIIDASSSIDISGYNLEMTINPNSQGMHSECTAVQEINIESDIAEENDTNTNVKEISSATVKSTFLTNMYIPKTINVGKPNKKVTDKDYNQEAQDIKESGTVDQKDMSLSDHAEMELAKEARNFPITVTRYGWDFDGRIVRGGYYLDFEYLPLVNKTKFVVEDMTFSKTAKTPEKLELQLLLPCIYTGKLPKSSPFNF